MAVGYERTDSGDVCGGHSLLRDRVGLEEQIEIGGVLKLRQAGWTCDLQLERAKGRRSRHMAVVRSQVMGTPSDPRLEHVQRNLGLTAQQESCHSDFLGTAWPLLGLSR